MNSRPENPEMESCGGFKAPGEKPRVRYADIFKPLDLDSLVYEKSELLLDGEPVIFAGKHHDTIIWLRRGSRVEKHYQAEVMSRLRLP